MSKLLDAHAGKLILAAFIVIFAGCYYLDELTPEVLACKEHGGKKIYGECWVPLRTVARTDGQRYERTEK